MIIEHTLQPGERSFVAEGMTFKIEYGDRLAHATKVRVDTKKGVIWIDILDKEIDYSVSYEVECKAIRGKAAKKAAVSRPPRQNYLSLQKGHWNA